METMTAPTEAPAVKLTLRHRCDQCHAQAFTGWLKAGVHETPLLLCAHHTREHEPVLGLTGFDMVADERHQLQPAT